MRPARQRSHSSRTNPCSTSPQPTIARSCRSTKAGNPPWPSSPPVCSMSSSRWSRTTSATVEHGVSRGTYGGGPSGRAMSTHPRTRRASPGPHAATACRTLFRGLQGPSEWRTPCQDGTAASQRGMGARACAARACCPSRSCLAQAIPVGVEPARSFSRRYGPRPGRQDVLDRVPRKPQGPGHGAHAMALGDEREDGGAPVVIQHGRARTPGGR
jgi:hypothetical protein